MFVKAIDGKKQTKSSYWLYYINGESGEIASDKYFPNPGDTVEWRLITGY